MTCEGIGSQRYCDITIYVSVINPVVLIEFCLWQVTEKTKKTDDVLHKL